MGNKSTLIKFMVVIGAALTLVGCSASEEAPREVRKPSLLVEHEGCRLYRYDAIVHYVYYVRCNNNEPVMTQHLQQCGKGCMRQQQSITTEEDIYTK